MGMMETIAARRSVRSFDGRALAPEARARLQALLDSARNPYGLPVRFFLLDGREKGLSSLVISGTELWLAGKLRQAPHAEEAFGFAMQEILLRAEEALGIGAVWLAGTLSRNAFEAAVDLQAGEVLPCVSPIGYPAERMSLRETVMRKGTGAAARLPFGTLFFEGSFDRPLSPEAAGDAVPLLEAVRRAPSAVNRQPWRVVRDGNAFHFYERRSRGCVDKTGWDLQKIDLGIALCHFALAAEALGREAVFSQEDPGLRAPENTSYLASYLLR